MTGKVTFKANFDLKRQLAERQHKLGKTIAQVCQDEIARIQLSTEAGKDIEGKQFKRYSPRYAAWRKSQGYRVSPPNLTVKGRMLGAMDYQVFVRSFSVFGRIFFRGAGAGAKARGNIGYGRKFFGLSKKRAREITKKIQEQF